MATTEIETVLPKLSYIFRPLVTLLLRHIPGGILKYRYDAVECLKSIDIMIDGLGPHIYIVSSRMPSIASFNMRIFNRLPFPVELIGFSKYEVRVEETKNLPLHAAPCNTKIDPYSMAVINIQEQCLTEGQVYTIKPYSPANALMLRFNGTALIKTPIGTLNKDFSLLTRGVLVSE